jgi:hypothetical protein
MDLADLAKKNWERADVVPGSVLECRYTGNFVYIYFNTNEGTSSFAVDDHVMQLGEKHAMKSLSFFTQLYRFVRDSSDFSQKLDGAKLITGLPMTQVATSSPGNKSYISSH